MKRFFWKVQLEARGEEASVTGRRAQRGVGRSLALRDLPAASCGLWRCHGEQSTPETGSGTPSVAGVPMCVTEGAEDTGLTRGTVRRRLSPSRQTVAAVEAVTVVSAWS